MTQVLLLDNDDSFTYNLKQLLEESGDASVVVRRTLEAKIDELRIYPKIVFSPGPALPKDFPLMYELLHTYVADAVWQQQTSILGVCLGHQAIGSFFGATLTRVIDTYGSVNHGRRMLMRILDHEGLYEGISSTTHVGLYHSWMVSKDGMPEELLITGEGDDGLVLSLRHKNYDIQGVQFHPESVITEEGNQILRNWLQR
jgi:anthranilate synthase component II